MQSKKASRLWSIRAKVISHFDRRRWRLQASLALFCSSRHWERYFLWCDHPLPPSRTTRARTFMSRLNGQDEQRLPSLLWDNRPARPRPCHSGPGSRRPDWIRIERARPRSERRGRTSSWPAVMLTIHNEWVHRFREHLHSRLGGKGRSGVDDRTSLVTLGWKAVYAARWPESNSVP